MQSEDLSNIENRVEIAKNKQIKVYYYPNNQKAHRRLRYQFDKFLPLSWFSNNYRHTHAVESYESSGRNLSIWK